jgi:adenine-specific DNA-methyltransferase
MQGFPLDSAATPLAGCRHNRVLRVTSDLVTHELYVCLDEHLHPATVEVLALRPEDVFVCLDSALDEETKLRLQDGRNVMVI